MNKAFIIAVLFFCLVKSIFFYTTCRNILTLTNNLELPDREMTLENYDEWIEKLNVTFPDQIAQLQPCDLEKFLSEVLLEHSIIFSEPSSLSLLHHCVSSFLPPPPLTVCIWDGSGFHRIH